MKRISSNRSDLVRMSIKYKHLIAGIRTKHPYGDKEYMRKSKVLKIKLYSFRRAIKNIDKINNKIKEIHQQFVDAFSFTLFLSARYWLPFIKKRNDPQILKKLILRKMFCKFTIEAGVPSSYISKFIGWEDPYKSAKYRGHINKNIKFDDSALEDWTRFKMKMNGKAGK